MDRRSGSRNRNGIFDTCSRFGCALDSARAVAAATAAATFCCCCWLCTTESCCWAVLNGTVPVPAVVVMVLLPVVMIQLPTPRPPPGLLLLLPPLLTNCCALLAAIRAAAVATSDGELQLMLLPLGLMFVWLMMVLLALETCVSGSVCCNNSVFLSGEFRLVCCGDCCVDVWVRE